MKVSMSLKLVHLLCCCVLFFTPTINAKEGKLIWYKDWSAGDYTDDFNGKHVCMANGSAVGKGSMTYPLNQMIFIHVNREYINTAGDTLNVIATYIYKDKPLYVTSSEQAEVLIDGSKYEFGSPNFFEAAKVGKEMNLRLKLKNYVFTHKYSLLGFTDAWRDANQRCTK